MAQRTARPPVPLAALPPREKLEELVRATPSGLSLQDLARKRFRQLREQSGMTQSALAEAMRGLGFKWTQSVVRDIERERGGRKLTLDELLALSAFWFVPLVTFLIPDEGEFVELGGKRRLPPADVGELVIGQGGSVGPIGAPWPTAARALGHDDPEFCPEPAVRLQVHRYYTSVAREIERHLPPGELDGEIRMKVSEEAGQLFLVRERDGAIYTLDREGVTKTVTNPDGSQTATVFVDGQEVFSGPGGNAA